MKKIIETLSKNPLLYLVEKSEAKQRDEKRREREEYIKKVKEIHESDIPSIIRHKKMNYSFKTDFSDTSIRPLNKKVEEFLKWYYENWIKGNYTDIGEFQEQQSIINFIEKMASWYEMRYPNFEINRMMPGSSQEPKYVDDIILNKNIDTISWKELFDYQAFLNTLSGEEVWYLRTPSFKQNYYFKNAEMGTLYINEEGIAKANEIRLNISEYHPHMVLGRSLYITEDFDNLNLLQIQSIMKEYNMLEDIAGIEKIIDEYQKEIEARERLLDCVMYRIIERGGNRIGPRRAFLFAKEFQRNIDIPMIYGIDHSDPGLRTFMNEYLKSGGNKNLQCCQNYFMRSNNNEELKTISMNELIKETWHNCVSKYTKEETELHQRLVEVLSSRVDREQEVKQLRLQRKL